MVDVSALSFQPLSWPLTGLVRLALRESSANRQLFDALAAWRNRR